MVGRVGELPTGYSEKSPGTVELDAQFIVLQRLLNLAEDETPDALAARTYLGVGLPIADDLGGESGEAAGVCNAVVEVITADPTILGDDQADANEAMPFHGRHRLIKRSPRCRVADGCMSAGTGVERWLGPPTKFP